MLGENLLTFFGTDMSEHMNHYVETTEQIFSIAQPTGVEDARLDLFLISLMVLDRQKHVRECEPLCEVQSRHTA
jgi:hypothetical protein